ncbi:MAG TPA: aldehyde dehydrogenase family protein, partial [Pyrinomonadaceae bacterium]|nr:aldehyde dehydrogenase family protein [Pyrinomonadaceae bacterium]
MDIALKGTSIIGFTRGRETEDTFTAFDPSTGQAIEPTFHSATAEELDRAAHLADEARIPFGNLPGRRRATFLRKIADNIEALGVTLVERAS